MLVRSGGGTKFIKLRRLDIPATTQLSTVLRCLKHDVSVTSLVEVYVACELKKVALQAGDSNGLLQYTNGIMEFIKREWQSKFSANKKLRN